MPAVGMRRSTRVLGARVLRSGRRLWTEPPNENGKFIRAVRENDWIDILDDSMGGGDVCDPCKDAWQGNCNGNTMDIVEEHKVEDVDRDVGDGKNVDKMLGIVYIRKRKREALKTSGSCEGKRFGKKYSRKNWRKKYQDTTPSGTGGDSSIDTATHQKLAVVAVKPSYASSHWISSFLCSVLCYMRGVDIRLQLLSVFVHSKPIFDAYSSHGILFLQGSVPIKNCGLCVISGSRSLMPMFTVDFSVVPFCFMYLHTCMQLRSARLAFVFVVVPLGINENIEELTSSQISLGEDTCNGNFFVSSIGGLRRRYLSQTTGGMPKLALQRMQYRNSRHVQKRSSRICKRGRPPSALRAKKSHGLLASDLLRFRQNATHSSSAAPSRILRSFAKTSPARYIKELKSVFGMEETRPSTHSKELKAAMGLIPQNKGASFCSANLLIIEADKCYREEGAIITLELSGSNQWVLAVMKDGMKRYSLATQNVMRTSCSNRFTHATLWSGDGDWKLEFPNKRDWLIFKELYKECSDRNVQAPTASVIPVPGVQVVSSPVQNNYIPYVRPDSYITVNDDELARAMMKMTANYDMDSGDEKWLNEFNDAMSSEGEIHELITPERFELVVDALEKGFHCNGDDHSDEKAAYDFCMHLERKEFIDAIHKYWIKKRRQKQSALVRIFQLYKPRRIQVIPRSILRKKRSFKRQASQAGRGKQQTFLQVGERGTSEHKNNLFKLQEARAIADRSELSAVLKRQRAQILMKNADLTTYKAIMALRIAEAAEITDPRCSGISFLGPLTE